MILLLIIGTSATKQASPDNSSVISSFDEGWRFIKDNPQGAENPAFDDSGWRKLDVPHDWSIEDLPNQNGDSIIGPFSKSSVDKMSSGYLIGGTGWYRKSFTLKATDKSKITYLQFDGVYLNSDVWLNGKHLGFHPYGYTPFYYDITSFLNPAGQTNIVAVRVRNDGLNSRWYSGSGITRHVWLTIVDAVHINVAGGVYITTPEVSDNSAGVKIVTTLCNSGSKEENFILQTQLFDPAGKLVGTSKSNTSLNADQTSEVSQKIEIERPSLWSIETPGLYKAKVSVLINNKATEFRTAVFGIRSIKISAESGLLINGKSYDLKGGCYHHDNGPLGAASIDRAEERKIEILKKAGFNAIRTSHNPPSPALLDACDRLGMVVIDEIFDMWEKSKKKQDYSLFFKEWWKKDVQSWIERDRNHPSVILWSIGNEIREASDTSGLRIAKNLTAEVHKLDPTRFVTEALVGGGGGAGGTGRNIWEEMAPHMALLDVVGYNYAFARYESDHIKYPNRIMVGTETNPPRALENWQLVKKLPYVIGYFVWTATDNIGEAGVGVPQLRDMTAAVPSNSPAPAAAPAPVVAGQPGPPAANAPGPPAGGGGFFRQDSWPIFNNYQGDLDLIGNRKVPSYYQYVVWGDSKVEIFVHRPIPEGKKEVTSGWGFPDELKSWNWSGREGQKFQVHVYTRSQLVKVELNGKLVGEQTVDQEKSITASFEVPFEPGILVARCFDDGKETASQTLKTTGKPASLRLVADRTKIRADRNDLSYVMAEVIDNDGNIVPDADNIVVNFEITGKGKIAGVGNGSHSDMSSFQLPQKKAYQGICLAIIRPEKTPGVINLKATAEGLKEASLTITAK
jgi:beta-galactosidase